MKKVLFPLLFALLIITTPVGAWELTIPPHKHYAGELSDATVLKGYIYAIGVEVYIDTSEPVHLVQCVGNTTLFKIAPNGTPLAKYTIIGGFCDEETWPSYGVEPFGDEIIVSGMSCVPRFKNRTWWVIALDENGGYRWGLSLPGYMAQAEVWNGSVVVAVTYEEGGRQIPIILWIDPTTGKIERAYSLPPNHAVLRFEINENGDIVAAGYDEHMLSWAGIIYPNGTIKLWETGIEAWDGPSVRAVGNESRFLIAVGWSNGTYLINPIIGSALFVEDIYPYALTVVNDSPVVISSYARGKSIIAKLDWNGSVESASFIANFSVLFVSDGLMGGYKGWYYSIAPFQPKGKDSVDLRALPVKAKIRKVISSLEPINLNAKPFKPKIESRSLVNINEGPEALPATLMINSTPSNLSAIITGENLTENCTAPCTLHLPPGNYTVNVTDGKSWNATTVTLDPNATATVLLKIPIKVPVEKTPVKTPAKEGTSYLPILGVLLAVTLGGAYLYLRRPGERGGDETTTRTEKAIEVKAGKAFGISHIGARDNNEDNLLVMKLPDAYLLAVADGLGGHNAGEVASLMAVETLKEVFEREYWKGMRDEEVKKLLEKAHKLAHERIKENATGEREGMGTTLVTAFLRNGKVIVANTGDSRAYLIRDGKIVERTKDHSLVQEMLDRGEITEEEAKRHPLRNIITKALGVDLGVDLYEWELRPRDVLLLSSDGLYDYVEEGKIVEIASSGRTPEEIARRLIEEALPVTKDNVTVVVWK